MQEFEHFNIPPLLLCDLYRESLIVLNEPSTKTTGDTTPRTPELTVNVPATAAWENHSRGNNVNGFWILVNVPGQTVLSEEDKTYLDAIIRACQRDPGETLVINLHGLDAAVFRDWAPKPSPRQVWMAGLEPGAISLPARFPAFQVQVLGEITYLWSPALADMKDKTSKATLWAALKQLFHIP